MTTHEAIIVGTGFGGMGAAISLKRLGIEDFVMLEREDDLGGTWHVNRYPGLAVDIASVTYSYSFEPNPWWSHWYARGPELKRYAEHVADRYDLRRHMRFGTVVQGAVWDEDAQEWEVRVAGGERLRAAYLVTATGFLSQPKKPDIAGVEDFAGEVLHSARWDDTADLDGKRVAIIGTGATAVQLIPELAKRAAHLTVFQRTPIWVTPKLDRQMPRLVQRLFARVPLTQRSARAVNTAVLEAIMVTGVIHYRQGKVFNRLAERVAKRHLRRQVDDPELRTKLTPDYSFGCKRPTFSNDYYKTFTRDHVELETTSIERVTPTGVVTTDGREHEIDVLVLATGFDMWDANFPAISVDRPRRAGPRAVLAGQPVPGLPGHRGPGLPQPAQPGLAVRLLGPVVLHDRRGADEAPRAAAGGGTPPRGAHLRGDRPGQRRVPRLGHRAPGRLGLQPRVLRDRAQLLLQPARRSRAAAAELDAAHAPGPGVVPPGRLRVQRLTLLSW